MSKLILSPLVKTRENRRLDWTPIPIVPEEQLMICPYVKCGKSFNKPIKLTVRLDDSIETYYACPHCFSRWSKPSAASP
jgi:DNA-directed RNA polymerase subunit RPC12/RpoP